MHQPEEQYPNPNGEELTLGKKIPDSDLDDYSRSIQTVNAKNARINQIIEEKNKLLEENNRLRGKLISIMGEEEVNRILTPPRYVNKLVGRDPRYFD
jgi:hypothetical protein